MKALRVAGQAALIALCLIPFGRQLTASWDSISTLMARLNAGAIIGAALLLVLASLFLPIAMSAFTAGFRNREASDARPTDRGISFRDSAVAYYASQPMKYLPGSFWILPGRVMLLQRMGHDPAVSSGGLLFEMIAQALSASLVAAVLLGLTGFASAGISGGAWLVLAGSAVACALLLAAPELLRRLNRGPASLRLTAARLAQVPLRARLGHLAATVLAFSIMWLIMGGSFYLLLVAGNPRLDLGLLKTAIGVSTLSWLAGFLTPFSPGGVGVREAAIVLLLGSLMSAPEATLVAVLARVLALLVEMAFAAGAWLMLRRAPLTHLTTPPSQRFLRITLSRAQPADAR